MSECSENLMEASCDGGWGARDSVVDLEVDHQDRVSVSCGVGVVGGGGVGVGWEMAVRTSNGE